MDGEMNILPIHFHQDPACNQDEIQLKDLLTREEKMDLIRRYIDIVHVPLKEDSIKAMDRFKPQQSTQLAEKKNNRVIVSVKKSFKRIGQTFSNVFKSRSTIQQRASQG